MIALITRLSLVVAGLTALILFLPASTGLPASVSESLSYFVGVARGFDWFLPLNTLFTALKMLWLAMTVFSQRLVRQLLLVFLVMLVATPVRLFLAISATLTFSRLVNLILMMAFCLRPLS